MPMRVIAKKTLDEFCRRHAEVESPLRAWYDHVKRANWLTPADVQRDYGSDVILPNNRAVFNIKGNNYRLVVAINYKTRIVFIRFIGTHAEYDDIDARMI
jgi:mRNA interferase HigB